MTAEVAPGFLQVTDTRTGRSYEIPINDGAIRSADLRQIKLSEDDFGLMSYDPAFLNTASCRSAVTFIDGDRGILRYRGYPIERLAEKTSFLEVAYLLLRGELPDKVQAEEWTARVGRHTFVHENVKKFIDGFHYDAQSHGHPRQHDRRTVDLLPRVEGHLRRASPPDPGRTSDRQDAHPGGLRLPPRHGPPLRAPGHRPVLHRQLPGHEVAQVRAQDQPDPVLERALDVLFILHGDHEQNCSANVMRAVGSSQADPYVAAAAAAAALYGPLHGGANEQVLKMLTEIGSVKAIPDYVARVKRGELRLMGFGHRVYKSFDPRARIIKEVADQVFEVTGRNPLLDIALELEKVALDDEYFISHKLYPNVDFYSGIIYQAMGFPLEMFPVLFAIGRMPGWLAQWEEGILDPEQKISRPRQLYVGRPARALTAR